MNRTTLILLIILAVTTIALIVLYFLGKRIQKRQDEQQAQIEANKQTFNMLVIDKKKLKFKEAGLPQSVVDSTPKWLRRSKVPVVRAKIGPQVMNLIADEKIFDQIPVQEQRGKTDAEKGNRGDFHIIGHFTDPPSGTPRKTRT